MRLIDIIEKDKDNLLSELAAAKTAEKAVRVLENELDKCLMQYNEACESERERDEAAHMMQAVRLSLPLIDSAGEMKVWETGSSEGNRKGINPLAFLLAAAALVLCGLGLLPLITSMTGAGVKVDYFRVIGMVALGLASAAAAGVLIRRPGPKASSRSQHVELRVDSGKIYRSFRNAILSVDQNLEEIRQMQRWESRDQAGQIEGRQVSSSELDLFSDLLAAAYSKDPEYALEKIEDIRYYLHRQKIQVVDYSDETRQYFDMMPGQIAGTIRPALVSEGTLLRKGIASGGAK